MCSLTYGYASTQFPPSARRRATAYGGERGVRLGEERVGERETGGTSSDDEVGRSVAHCQGLCNGTRRMPPLALGPAHRLLEARRRAARGFAIRRIDQEI